MSRKSIEEKALKLYKETDDWEEVGWILPSGKLLEWGDTHDEMAEKIDDCTREELIQQGWIRVVTQEVTGIHMRADGVPTIAQLRRVYELVDQMGREEFIIDTTSKDGRNLKSVQPPDPDQVLYYMGALHQVGFDEIYNAKMKEGE